MPQNPDLIATKAVTGEVLVFDRTKHSSEPERGGVCKPDIRLVGQTREGWVSSRAWICSGADAAKVRASVESPQGWACAWGIGGYDYLPLVSSFSFVQSSLSHSSYRDINSYTKSKTSIEPTNIFRGHTSVVGVSTVYILV
jgi:histone-binding protein RBBP4